jgi:hypothetical protein
MSATSFDFHFVNAYDDSLVTDATLKPLISARVTTMTQFLRMFPGVRTLRTRLVYNTNTYRISLTMQK